MMIKQEPGVVKDVELKQGEAGRIVFIDFIFSPHLISLLLFALKGGDGPDCDSDFEMGETRKELSPVRSGPLVSCSCGCEKVFAQMSEYVSCACAPGVCSELIQKTCHDANRTCAASRRHRGQHYRISGKEDELRRVLV